ncbi:MAG: enoyl-CoA hydratase/isomerase family protein [Actinobacteria bacterium]|nr:enoyl-CoA hydratase/isomerase family protein [Actinomycetota bacterium]
MPGSLIVDRPADGILRLAISNPATRNALDHAVLGAISDELAGLGDDVRCVIVTGAHEMFSSGYDISEIPLGEFPVQAEKLVAHPFCRGLMALDALDIPTLAVLPGSAIGGGLELAVACDLRLASSHIKLGMPPAKLGLIYSHNGLRRFIDTVGAPRTRELFLLGRYIDAPTAARWGLVNWVVDEDDLEESALAIASQLVANSPLSMAGNKRVLRELLQAEGALDPDVERELLALRASSFDSEDLIEGISAFTQKRSPSWKGR